MRCMKCELDQTRTKNGGADMHVYLDAGEVKEYYSGHSYVDVTALMTHELIHGLGFGNGYDRAKGSPSTKFGSTVWDYYSKYQQGDWYFDFKSSNANSVPLAHYDPFKVPGYDHLAADLDLMGGPLDPRQTGLDPFKISPDVKSILAEMGYGVTAPPWWKDNKIADAATMSPSPVAWSDMTNEGHDRGTWHSGGSDWLLT
jgi:hypothetical protein